MTQILEIKEKIKKIYAQYEFLIIPFAKFLLALIVFMTINNRMGYMAKLNSKAIVLAVSLLCSFLPSGLMVFFAALFTVAHFYSMAMEVAIITLVLYMVLFMLVFRMGPKESALVVITPLLCALKLPYVTPIAAGLLCSSGAFVPVACGTVVYYFLHSMIGMAPTLRTMEADDILSRVRLIIDTILANKAMIVVAVAFAVTTLIVYFVRRLSVDYAWTIAMAVGALVNAVLLLVGALKANIDASLGSILLGTLVALIICKIIEFFRFCVDYSRTEHVQFEDDEYYYYVKAVPKMTVATPEKTVKTINGGSDRRGVVTERTGTRTEDVRSDRRKKSVTVGNTDDGYAYPEDDYLPGEEFVQDGEYVEEGGYYTEDGEYVEGTYEGEYYGDEEYSEEGDYYEGEGSGEGYEDDGTYSETGNYEEPYNDEFYEEDGEGNKY